MINRSSLLGLGRILWMAAALAVAPASLRADDGATQDADDADSEVSRRAAFVRTMHSMAAGLRVVRSTADGETECKMVEDTVLNWVDSARHPDLIDPGTTWIWHDKGRPVMIGEIYGRVNSVGAWSFLACNLTSDAIRYSDGSVKTAFTKSFYDPKPIDDAPVVAKTKVGRTFQMRQLTDRFDAHQFWKERFELRLLPKPIYRYEDPESRLVDGAVFALVHGTNPEVLLLVEAHAADDGAARWKVAFGTLAGARCVVRLDGKEFWTCPTFTGDPADPRQGITKFVPVDEGEKPLVEPQGDE